MPFANYHSARITDPAKFTKFAYKKNAGGSGVDFVFGVVDEGQSELQAVRFHKKRYSAKQAKKWLKRNDRAYTEFAQARSSSNMAKAVHGELWRLASAQAVDHYKDRVTLCEVVKIYDTLKKSHKYYQEKHNDNGEIRFIIKRSERHHS